MVELGGGHVFITGWAEVLVFIVQFLRQYAIAGFGEPGDQAGVIFVNQTEMQFPLNQYGSNLIGRTLIDIIYFQRINTKRQQ